MDDQTRVVGEHERVVVHVVAQCGGLDPGVLEQRHPGLLGIEPVGRPADARAREQGLELVDLVRVARREDDPHRARIAHATATDCAARSERMPDSARSSSMSSSAREKVLPSAVACTSTSVPAPVITTFMSDSARESSM